MTRLLNRLPNIIDGSSFDSDGPSKATKLSNSLVDVLGLVEQSRKNKRDSDIIAGRQPKDGQGDSSALGRILGAFDPNKAPTTGPTDLEKSVFGRSLKGDSGVQDFEILKEAFRQVAKEKGVGSQQAFQGMTDEQRRQFQQEVMRRAGQLKEGVVPVVDQATRPEAKTEQPAKKGVVNRLKKIGSALLDVLGDADPSEEQGTNRKGVQDFFDAKVPKAPQATNQNIISQASRTAVNPQTGQTIYFVNGRWVDGNGNPVQ